MGKNKKLKTEAASSDVEVVKGYVPRHFSNVVWTDEFKNTHLISLLGKNHSCIYLEVEISNFLVNELLLERIENCWNVTYSRDKFYETAEFELTNVFARTWLDYYIDRVSDAIYSVTYRDVFNNSEFKDNTTKRDKEADKAGLEIQNTFLKYIENYNKEFK